MEKDIEKQAENASVQDTETEKADDANAELAEKGDEYIAPSKEQYEKAMQSERSKAKYSILKDLGITSVDQFKAEKAKLDDELKAAESKKAEYDALANENQRLKEDIMLRDLGVDESRKADLLILAKSNAVDGKDLKTAAQEILERNPNWKTQKPISMGTERSEQQGAAESKLAERYPWLK